MTFAPFFGHKAEEFRKADVIADCKSHGTKFRFKYCDVISGREDGGFLKMLAIFYINIEKMHFPVPGNLSAVPVKHISCVVYFPVRVPLGHSAGRKIYAGIAGKVRACLPERPALFLCKIGKTSDIIRTAEHLGKDEKAGISFYGLLSEAFQYFGEFLSVCVYGHLRLRDP